MGGFACLPDALELPLEQEHASLMTARAAVVHRELAWRDPALPHCAAPQRCPGVFAVLAQRVKLQVEPRQLGHVAIEIPCDTLQSVQTRGLWVHSVAHVLDDRVRAGDANVFLAASGRTRRADILIDVQTRSDNRRIPYPSRDFPG